MRAFYYCVWNYRVEDEEFLKEKEVKYEWYKEASYSWLIVDVDEKDPACSRVLEMANKNICFRNYEYSRNDLNNAEYLTIRTKNMSFDLAREDDLFDLSEPIQPRQFRHKQLRTMDFYINKPIKWGRGHIKASFTLSEAQLFCDDYAMAFFSQYSDLNLRPVFHNRTGEVMDNIHYIQFNKVLSNEVICLNHEEAYTCPECGRKTWLIKTDHQLCLYKNTLPQNLSFAKTQDIWGNGGCYTYPINIVSQAVYQSMKAAGLNQNSLLFEPVFLK